MIGDRELGEFRREYYELLGALLGREPSGTLLGTLARGATDRAEPARQLHPALGEGWAVVASCLGGQPPGGEAGADAVADEFTRLFLGPLAPELQPYESYYVTGRLFGPPLVAIRGLLAELELERDPAYPEPEDSVAFELSVMARLVAGQLTALDPDAETHCVRRQARFAKQHLLVWAPTFAGDLERAPGARLYRGVARLLSGFLALEREVLDGWGPAKVPTLDEARAAYGDSGAWRGPLFEPPVGQAGSQVAPDSRGGSPSPPSLSA